MRTLRHWEAESLFRVALRVRGNYEAHRLGSWPEVTWLQGQGRYVER